MQKKLDKIAKWNTFRKNRTNLINLYIDMKRKTYNQKQLWTIIQLQLILN